MYLEKLETLRKFTESGHQGDLRKIKKLSPIAAGFRIRGGPQPEIAVLELSVPSQYKNLL